MTCKELFSRIVKLDFLALFYKLLATPESFDFFFWANLEYSTGENFRDKQQKRMSRSSNLMLYDFDSKGRQSLNLKSNSKVRCFQISILENFKKY